jgi:hypothetical protein
MNTPSIAEAEAIIASQKIEIADLKAKIKAIEDIIHPRPASVGFKSASGILTGNSGPDLTSGGDDLPPADTLNEDNM